MDPISISIELELGTVLVAAVGALATWLHNRHQKSRHQQRERHYQQTQAAAERRHRDHMQVLKETGVMPPAMMVDHDRAR